MKRIFFVLMSLWILSPGGISAQEDAQTVKTSAPARPASKQRLVGLEDNSSSRINDLERRLSSLEKEVRSQYDYMRNLEREIDYLRRRRIN